MNAMTMSVLGPELTAVSTLPLLEVVQLIRLANFIERLDVLVTLLLYIGLYVKMTLFYIASVLMISSLFKLKNGRVGLVIIILIIVMSFSETELFCTYLDRPGHYGEVVYNLSDSDSAAASHCRRFERPWKKERRKHRRGRFNSAMSGT